MSNTEKLSMGARIPGEQIDKHLGDDNYLNDVDIALVEYAASMVSVGDNIAEKSDGMDTKAGRQFSRSIAVVAAGAVQARATLESAETVAASIDRLACAVALLADALNPRYETTTSVSPDGITRAALVRVKT